MFNLIFLVLFSCAKQKETNRLGDLIKQGQLTSPCLVSLQTRLEEEGKCSHMEYATTSRFDMLMKCYDPPAQNYWSTNVFRISAVGIEYKNGDAEFVHAHTICLDEEWRIEVYDPKFRKNL
jgi:hypothetical protein